MFALRRRHYDHTLPLLLRERGQWLALLLLPLVPAVGDPRALSMPLALWSQPGRAADAAMLCTGWWLLTIGWLWLQRPALRQPLLDWLHASCFTARDRWLSDVRLAVPAIGPFWLPVLAGPVLTPTGSTLVLAAIATVALLITGVWAIRSQAPERVLHWLGHWRPQIAAAQQLRHATTRWHALRLLDRRLLALRSAVISRLLLTVAVVALARHLAHTTEHAAPRLIGGVFVFALWASMGIALLQQRSLQRHFTQWLGPSLERQYARSEAALLWTLTTLSALALTTLQPVAVLWAIALGALTTPMPYAGAHSSHRAVVLVVCAALLSASFGVLL